MLALVAALAVCATSAAAQPLAPPAAPPAAPAASAPGVKQAVPPPPPAFPVEVAIAPLVTARAGEVTVGDRVEAILTLKVPASRLSGEPRFPVWRDSWGDVEVRDKPAAQKISEQGGTAVYRQRLLIVPWKVGRLTLPPAVVAVPLSDRTVEARTPADLALDVVSVLPKVKKGDPQPEPKGAAPMVPLPLGSRFWWTAAGFAAACAVAGALLVLRERRAARLAAAPPLPPFEALLVEIRLLESRLGAERSTLGIHTDLSRALRAYLGRTLAFPASESTTAEIQRQLTARRLPAALPRRTVELLRGCDLVKFARQEVGQARTHERLETARALAGEVERQVHPPEESAAAEGSPFVKAG